MTKQKLLIGIDPDVDKSGVGINHNGEITLLNLSFFELFDKLKDMRFYDVPMLVIVEGGWLNQGNWHKDKSGSAAKNAKIGNHTGRNHETGRKIVEMLEYLNIKHLVVKPTTSKINAKVFKMMTKYEGRTNQEQRDAYMLIHGI